jgi:hypothetical protein
MLLSIILDILPKIQTLLIKHSLELYIHLQLTSELANQNPELHLGKLMQFVPEESIYTYFRCDEKKTVMVVMNANDSGKNISTERFSERIQGKSEAFDVIEIKNISFSNLQLKPWEVKVLEF